MKQRYETYEEALIAGRLARAVVLPLIPGATLKLAVEPRKSGPGFKFSISVGTLRIQSFAPDEFTVWDDQSPIKVSQSLSELCDQVRIILF